MTFIETNSNDIKNIEPVVKTIMNNLVKMLKKIKLMLYTMKKNLNEKKKKEIRGREIRRQNTALFKVAVIDELQPGVTQDQVANKYCINQPLISKWYKEKVSIIAAATNKHKKLFAKQKESTKYLDIHKALFQELKKTIGKGLKGNFNWLGVKHELLIKI